MTFDPNQYEAVFALTGPIASGKGIAVRAILQILEEKGVDSIMLSDHIREVVKEKEIEISRDNLRLAGNELRNKKGSGAWAELALSKLESRNNNKILIIDSIRVPGEIDVIHKIFGKKAMIIATHAETEERIARVINRKEIKSRKEDSYDPEEIRRDMKIEMDPTYGFNIEGCRRMADFVTSQTETKQQFIDQVQREISLYFPHLEGDETKENNEARPEHGRERKAA